MRRLRLLPLVLGLTLVGCAGPAPAVQAPAADPQRLEALQKGLTAAQVRELAGEPLEIKPFKAGDLRSEIWVYHRVISQETRPVAVTTQDVPVTNPLTGQTGMIAEPVTSYEFIKKSEIIELLMINGSLIEWKRRPQIDRTFN